MFNPVSDLAAVTALAILMKEAGVSIMGISVNDLAADVQIPFEGWPAARSILGGGGGIVSESTRQDNDDFQHIPHRLTFPNRVALVSIERRSINAA